ncbi:SDR family oxidoreductase [Youhaiella tibetensis]|uniref:SDR family oxidoreductase n=1 Tax=Paradevosia tibetensis TaxID=1447062 RepID=A0A5B9DLK6_9HYPH|nr:SDR family oxidoreductase [Youhaiella tibetensis]QEE19288.1 SDR family oxidoreductase [Youhaiella tibetensis]GGF34503.1 SDR family oxidoreductase [Youhaiella tibetensis]
MAETPSPFRMDGKHVLITGAGGGIGRALTQVFAEAGAVVTGADRDPTLMEGMDLAHRLVFELTEPDTIAKIISSHIALHGAPDALISNAGYTRGEVFEQVDNAVWASEVEINLNGAYYVTHPVVEAMEEKGGGSVVFVSSVNGLGHYGNPAYSAAKAGLISFAKGLAVERGYRGIRANVVCPGSVRTPAWDHRIAANPELLDKVLPHYPLGRMVTPEEVARAALFLASPAASGITGAAIPVDAGLTSGNLRFVNEVLKGGA